MSNDGLLLENMDRSHIHLAVSFCTPDFRARIFWIFFLWLSSRHKKSHQTTTVFIQNED